MVDGLQVAVKSEYSSTMMSSYMHHQDISHNWDAAARSERRVIGQLAEADMDNFVALRLPPLLREKQLRWNESDKIFASQWLSEDHVLVGTKCNKLYLVDTQSTEATISSVEVPTLSNTPLERSQSSGIHSVSMSPNGRYLSTTGKHPNDLAVYQLPQLAPLQLGQAHTDWIFDIQWISDSLVITGSRDATMVLWAIKEGDPPHCLAEKTTLFDPLFHFSNVRSLPSDCGERVRSLAFHKNSLELGSLQTNPCGAAVHFWDVYTFQQVNSYQMPFCAENVCLEVDDSGTGLYAVGSRSHVTLIDSRLASSQPPPTAFRSPDKDCGVRSLNFNSGLLSMGTGAGHVYFYDMRARAYLLEDELTYKKCFLHSTPGWLRKDQTYRDFFSGLPRPPNALYTHSYSPMRTKIFTAGGPLPLGLYGNYAAVWI